VAQAPLYAAGMSSRRVALAAVVLSLWGRSARADVILPALVSDGMVLQRKAPVRVWGWAAEGERVTVTLPGQTATATASGGWWAVTLKPLALGAPFDITIAGRNTIVVHDVVVGDVWVCSGQSNMEFPLERSADAQADIDAEADPLLRMFTVGRQLAQSPKPDLSGGAWESATPQARAQFSAVGFYFGRALRSALDVPIGLIHTSWGGTPAEAWTSRSTLEAWGMPQQAFAALVPPTAAARSAYERRLNEWQAAGRPRGEFDDPGVAEAAKSWAQPVLDTSQWRSMALPAPWERLGPDMEVDGGIWLRKEVALPPVWAGRELELHLGAIDDLDTTYFNGVPVGATRAEVPNHWQVARRYRVPAAAVRAGRAVVAVRVWDRGGEGGFMGPASEMWIAPVGGADAERVALTGEWRFRAEQTRPSMPNPPGLNQNQPSVLYNGMVAPLLPYAIRGATWYQGESNTGRSTEYRSLLTSMIQSWRAAWQMGDFPFLIVQLAPYMAIDAEPRESGWAALREAQDRVAREVKNTGLVVITDVGDEKDIHPIRKKPVGERLALWARKLAYGENVVASGPSFRSAAVSGSKIVVSFDHVGKGLEVRGDRLTGFAIAGSDGKFVNAEASLTGSRVSVSSPSVTSPAYVRFGWANYPVVNLWNKDGLPAVPFRTDPH
jgi:sialate O-acetylesterase